MRRLAGIVGSIFFIVACRLPRGASAIDIGLAHDSVDERGTRDQLQRLSSRYDLSMWRLTDRVIIDDDDTPHSHPTLTLHTRHRKDDLLLLSTYIHEQSHWCFTANQRATDLVVAELTPFFPGLPVGFPEGATSLTSSYEHLLVIAFEWRGLRNLVGELAARQVMEFWATDHYRAIYRAVLTNPKEIWRVLEKHGFHVPTVDTRCHA